MTIELTRQLFEYISTGIHVTSSNTMQIYGVNPMAIQTVAAGDV